MNLRVVIRVPHVVTVDDLPVYSPRSAVACCIECARHHGYEPVRLVLPSEADEPCYLCGENDSEV